MNISFSKATLVSLFTIVLPAQGQIPNFAFEHLSIEQGMPSSTAYSMAQDRNGFIWLGTTAGLCRYDGFSFELYGNEAMLYQAAIHEDRSGDIWFTPRGKVHRIDHATGKVRRYQLWPRSKAASILEDSEGVIWVATMGDGLARYVPRTDTFMVYTHDPSDSSSLCSNTIWTLIQDRQGNIWLGTTNGVDRLDKENGKFIHCEPTSGNSVECILEDDAHTLWIGTNDGLCSYEPSTGRFERHRSKEVRGNYVPSVWFSASKELFVAIGGRITRFNRDTKTFHVFTASDSVTAIEPGGYISNHFFEDRRGRLWVSTAGGLALLDRTRELLRVFKPRPEDPSSIAEGYLTSMMEDRARNLWIGTGSRGICILNEINTPFVHIAQHPYDRIQLSHPFVSAILEDCAGAVWVGSHHGIDRLDFSTGSRTHYDENAKDGFSLANRRIAAMVEDGPENLWIGTSSGLCLFSRKTGRFTPYPHHAREAGLDATQDIMSICIDRQGTMWLGGGVGSGLLIRFDRTKREFTNYYVVDFPGYTGGSSWPLGQLFEDKTGALWLPTRGGIALFDRETGQAKHYVSDSSRTETAGNTAFCEDAAGIIWTGSKNGLARFDRATGTFNPVALLSGRESPIYRLEDDSGSIRGNGQPGNLWMLTDYGISRFNPVTGKFTKYGPAEGVPLGPGAFAVACFKNRQGYMYFGGTNGFVKFHPDSVRENTYVPPVLITSFKKFNVEAELDSAITVKRTIELAHDENDLSFSFAALNYSRPEKNQYAYTLEGHDRGWVYCGTRHTTMYTNLEPGSYLFRVRGSNNDGVWNEVGTSILLVIHPPFWRTWWAYLLYVLFAAGLLYSAFRFQRNRLVLRHEVEVKEVEARKLKEVNEIKSRFFANISHEFRTPLTLILGPISKWKGKVEEGALKKDLSLVERSSQRLLRLVNQLLDLSKLEAGGMRLHVHCLNVVPLVRGIAYSFESSAGIRGIALNVRAEAEEIPLYCDKDVMEKILTNLLSNAFKFTGKGGRIEVTVDRRPPSDGARDEGQVAITVADTGTGIAEEHLAHIFDRFYQADDSTTREQEGTGIGLALVKELVELHHGTIAVASTLGVGTSFTVCIPFGKEHLQAEEIVELSEEEEEEKDGVGRTAEAPPSEAPVESVDSHPNHATPPGRDGEKPLILVVEDNADVRDYIRDNLPACYQVLEARDGVEGVERAIETVPDLVLSDVMMPKMDGFEFCKRLKTDERTSHIPVILLTAKASIPDKIQGLETGADAYIMKPFEPEELKARIRNLIEQRRRLQEHFKKHGLLSFDDSKVLSIDKKFLEKVQQIIMENMANASFGVESLAEMAAVSHSVLHRKIVSLTGEPPVDLIRRTRLTRAAALIQMKFGNLTQIALEVGLQNPSYFAECFKKQFGVLPSQYARTLPIQ